MSGAQLLSMFTEQVELLQVQRDAGASQEQLMTASDSALAAFLAQAGLTQTLARGDAITMIRMLVPSQFRETHRTNIIGAINGVGQPHPSASGDRVARQQLQSFNEFYKYPTRRLSALVADGNTPYGHKIQSLGEFLSRLGAANLNEPGWCGIVATWFALETPQCGGALPASYNPSSAYQRLQDLKTWMRCHRHRCRMSHHGQVIMFPSNPN